MGITHLKDGEGFFDGAHAETHRDFGFSGSAPAVQRQSYAKGGSVMKAKPPFAKQSRGIEQMHDESELAHRVRKANGGGVQVPTDAPFPVEPTSMPRQLGALGDGGVKMAKGGHADAAQDKALISKMLKQHEKAEGEPMRKADGGSVDKYARGGRARLPRGMKPPAMQSHSPINTPPRNPTRTVTPRNIMPGGAMAYGVQPSSEPDPAGSEQGIPQLRNGGKVRY